VARKLQKSLRILPNPSGEPTIMKKTLVALAAVMAAGLVPTASYADVAFNAGVVTDYRYRGLSQTRLKPALQGGVDYSAGAFYLGAWGSTIKWIKDAGGDADVEIDLYGGYKTEIAKDLTLDVGGLYYAYPSNKLSPSANTFEVYGALTYGPATLKYSHSTTNLFGFPESKNSGYVDLSATFDVAGFAVTPHVGHQKVKNNGAASYTDYSLTVAKEVMKGLTLSATIVDTDIEVISMGKDLGKASLVVGAKFAF